MMLPLTLMATRSLANGRLDKADTHPLGPWQKQFWFCNHTIREGSKCWKEHLQAFYEIGI
jgi:hypothetical protein